MPSSGSSCLCSRVAKSLDTSEFGSSRSPNDGRDPGTVPCTPRLALGDALVAERALLHDMLLVRRDVRITRGKVNGMMWLFPVEAAHPGVGACAHAHAATDALVVVLAHDTRLGILVGRTPTGHTFTQAGFSQCWQLMGTKSICKL